MFRTKIKPAENKFLLIDCLYNAFHTSFSHLREGNMIKMKFSISKYLSNVRSIFARILSIRAKSSFCLSTKALRNIAESEGKPYVLHVICNMEIGGSQKIILDLFEYMTGTYKMKILTGHIPFYVRYPELPVVVLNKQKEISELLRNEKPDIVHFHYWGLDSWMRMFLDTAFELKSELGFKIIENSNNPIPAFYENRVDHIAHVSRFVLDLQGKDIPLAKQSVVYPGVDEDIFNFTSLRQDECSAGMVYRLTNDKISAETIELLIKICKIIPNVLIYVIGDGPNLRHFIRRASQESVRSNIVFTGFAGYEQLNHYYELFNVFLAPVHHESYGVVMPYALFKGNPIVAYNVDAVEELLTRNNPVVDSEEEFIRSVIEILTEKIDVKNQVSRNRKIAEERFTLKKMIYDYDVIYQSLLKDFSQGK